MFIVVPMHGKVRQLSGEAKPVSDLHRTRAVFSFPDTSGEGRPVSAAQALFEYRTAKEGMDHGFHGWDLDPATACDPRNPWSTQLKPGQVQSNRIRPNAVNCQLGSSRGDLDRTRSRWIVLDQARSSSEPGGRGSATVELLFFSATRRHSSLCRAAILNLAHE